jgi:uncharacterized protein with PQ loop repeat
MMHVPEILGFAGIGVVAIAYAPQIVHLHKEHCSAGISLRAYSLWCVSSALFLIHAVMIRDIVFTVVQLINLVAIVVITVLVKRYSGHVCLTHFQAQLTLGGGTVTARRYAWRMPSRSASR